MLYIYQEYFIFYVNTSTGQFIFSTPHGGHLFIQMKFLMMSLSLEVLGLVLGVVIL